MNDWADFFVAQVGASGALAGLVIVAISINLSRIVAFPWLPGRAAETLAAPTGVLVVSSYMLVPHQPTWQLAMEVGATGAAMWLIPVVIQIRTLRGGHDLPRRSFVARFILTQMSSIPIIASAILIQNNAPNAVAWMVPGIIASMIATVINAWVLLVEILR